MELSFYQYLSALRGTYTKLARLEFLNPGGGVAFALDNNERSSRNGAFIQNGQLSVNLQNGQRRTASITLANLNGEYDYKIGKLWFGQQVRLLEGISTDSGEIYFPQGVFYIKDPEEALLPGQKAVTLNLEDKWSYLNGTLFGKLDGTYEITAGTNIFTAINSILQIDRGNGFPIDSEVPLFTNFYNDRTTPMPDGTEISDLLLPYTYRLDGDNGTYADIILEMANILAAWVGYDANGRLRIDPSERDIDYATKAVQWEFGPEQVQFLGANYVTKNSSVYNDIIVVGGSIDEYGYTSARAENTELGSNTNIGIIGRKTLKETHSELYNDRLCKNLANFILKQQTILNKSATISCGQMFHLHENQLVTVRNPGNENARPERYLVNGFTRPIAQTGAMKISATSVNSIPGESAVYNGVTARTARLLIGAARTGESLFQQARAV